MFEKWFTSVWIHVYFNDEFEFLNPYDLCRYFVITVFPLIVAAAIILLWVYKNLKISYSFPIKFSLM